MQLLQIGKMDKDNFYKILEDNLLLNDESMADLEKLTENYPFFQAAWLLFLKNLRVTGSPDLERFIKRAAPMLPDRRILYNFLFRDETDQGGEFYYEPPEVFLSPSTPADDDYGKKENILINEFLARSGEHIKINKETVKEPDESEDVISKSLAESDELITETLAMIYFEQKKYDKALDAFKKLSLKYPEKSIYFAARIEEIGKIKKFNHN